MAPSPLRLVKECLIMGKFKTLIPVGKNKQLDILHNRTMLFLMIRMTMRKVFKK